MKSLWTLTIVALALGSVQRARSEPTAVEAPPNVVIIFCDDLGYGDIGVHGAQGYQTPNIDRLAAQGIRFTHFYSAQPVCSASRAALLTGCYPNRIGIHGALGPRSKVGIHADETTLAELLKAQGYATAIFGKWHLGHERKFLPLQHGFDEYFGLPYSNDMWPFHPGFVNLPPERARREGFPDLSLLKDNEVVMPAVGPQEQRQLTTWYTEHAVRFIEQNKQRPFFLYLPHSMPHVPLYVSDKFQGKSERGLFGDVIQEIDWSVGEILAALDEHALAEKTLVVFTSDNGPWLAYGNHAGTAGPLREGKGTSWEGGVREPFFARWPGQIPAGSVCNEPAMTIDLLPTIAGRAGAEFDPQRIDGLDIWPLLRGDAEAKSPHDAFYFYYHANELQAVMSGHWKLYLPHVYGTLAGQPGGREGLPVRYQQRAVEQPELYDLEADQGETRDVAAEHPERVKQLLAYAERARQDLGDARTGRAGTGRREPGRVKD